MQACNVIFARPLTLRMNPNETRARIEKNLPPQRRDLLSHIRRMAEAKGLPVYLVGGFVRDFLLGLTPDDFDFAVEGNAPAFARAVAHDLGGEVMAHAPFGTATWLGPEGLAIDFATARTETYAQPATLPEVTPGTSIVADLRRRDFTINAMALRVDGEHFGELLDPHGGQSDLAARVVRVLHPGSFVDDPTRLFRAVRYEMRLGFAIAPDTLALIPEARAALAALTGDRVRHEFELIFREPRAVAMLARLARLEVLSQVHLALRWGEREAAQAATIPALPAAEWQLAAPPEPQALYFALMLGAASPVEVTSALARLNPNHAVARAVVEAVHLRVTWTRPSEAVAILDELSELGVVAAYVLHEGARAALNDYLAHWRFVHPETTGDDLIAHSLTPGPQFRRLLWQLRAAWLDGVISDAAGEETLLLQLLAEMK